MIVKYLYEPNLEIASEELLIRPIRESDQSALLEIYGDEQIYRYRPGLPRKTARLIEKLLQGFRKEMEEKTAVYLAVCNIQDISRPIGTVEIFHMEPRIEKVEIGYTISVKEQGKGYGKKTVGMLTEYLFNICEANRITATVHPDNIVSQKVLLKNGFIKEGVEREGAFWQGIGYVDIVCFGKLKKD